MPATMSRETFDRISELLGGGLTFGQIGECCGVTDTAVRTVARGEHAYQRPKGWKQPREAYLPSPEEIEAACREFREAKRAELHAWTVPFCVVPEG